MTRAIRVAGARGFALIDLAIATLVGGLVTSLTSRVDLSKSASTDRLLARAQVALLGYAMIHGQLPCPADSSIPSGAPGAGHAEPRVWGECPRGYFGALPWATLNTAEFDAWGRRFSYRASREFTREQSSCAEGWRIGPKLCLRAPTTSMAYRVSADALELRERRTLGTYASGTEPIAHSVAAVVISHGRNRRFGYTSSGIREVVSEHDESDEARNASPETVSFVTPTPGLPDDRTGAIIDDRLAWVSRGELLSALARAGQMKE